jgi:hypothetical protein
VVAGLELAAWLAVYLRYRHNRKNFIKQGHGPLPKGCWISPDWRAVRPGDLILFSGNMAGRLHETVGHGELALRRPDGEMVTFTSYMEYGSLFHNLKAILDGQFAYGHYIVLRLRQGFTEAQNIAGLALAEQMLAANVRYKNRANASRARFFMRLPLPIMWRAKLIKRFHVSGYDWLGLFTGRIASDHWICVVADLELIHKLGIKTAQYGTGLFGLGTGILDPISPVRFLADPAFHLLTLDDKAEFERLHSQG